jgi:hypothetical protein
MSAEQDVVPEGYVPHVRTSPVTKPWQPLFAKIAEGTVSLALRIRAAHCNGKRVHAWRRYQRVGRQCDGTLDH